MQNIFGTGTMRTGGSLVLSITKLIKTLRLFVKFFIFYVIFTKNTETILVMKFYINYLENYPKIIF